MRIVVLGAGATGSLFGARLAAARESVVLIGRADHVAAIRDGGLVVEGIGAGTVPLEATTQLAPGTAADAVLVTVKSFDLAGAAADLGRALAPTPTALLGNGLGIEQTAHKALRDAGWPRPEVSVVRAVHTVPATWVGPGRIRASGTGEVVLPTAGAARAAAGSAELFAELFRRSGYPVRRSSSLDREVWRKLVVNAAINPVTAVHGVPNGALLAGELRGQAEALLGEAVEVARRSGIDLALSEARSDLDRVVRTTAENRSSMLQDVDRGRATEIDAISGEILRRGRALGMELPATARTVHDLEQRRRAGPAPAKR